MSKGVKIALGAVAAIAVPFIAPVIAGAIGLSTAIGSSLASGLVGSVLGGAAGAATGAGARGALLGAATGGLGGFLGGGGFGQLFGGIGGGAGAGGTGGTGGVLSSLTGGNVGQVGLSTVPASGLPTLGGAATAASPGILSNVVNSVIQNAPNALAQLSLLAFNKPPQELTAAQQQVLAQMQEDAKTNKELFSQRLELAQNLVRQGQSPDFVGAYANAIVPAQRAFREEERTAAARGASPEALAVMRRTGIIETTGRAPRSVAGANEQALRLLNAGLGAMPTQAPVDKTAATALSIAERNKAEQDKQREQYSRIAGGLFGTPGFGQNRYGGAGAKTTQPTTRTAGITEPTSSYGSIYSGVTEEPTWTSSAFG